MTDERDFLAEAAWAIFKLNKPALKKLQEFAAADPTSFSAYRLGHIEAEALRLSYASAST